MAGMSQQVVVRRHNRICKGDQNIAVRDATGCFNLMGGESREIDRRAL